MIDIFLVANPKRPGTTPEAAFLAACREVIAETPIDRRTYL